MIIGVIPVGGKGKRLGLGFSKEMLPQKGYDYYNPVINHLVTKMELAGAKKIYFIHGRNLKQDIIKYFKANKYIHISQSKLGFARVLSAFYMHVNSIQHAEDEILFGLPDSYFDGNPFLSMIRHDGIVCGLFKADPSMKVDRLINGTQTFEIKTPKTPNNSDFFWGLIKFDFKDLKDIIDTIDFSKTTEIGEILNVKEKKILKFGNFIDLGTWNNLNLYWKSKSSQSNSEMERKYNADNVSFADFDNVVTDLNPVKHINVAGWDYYFTCPENPNIQFVRFRDVDKQNIDVSSMDITVKDFKSSLTNRFELLVNLDKYKNSTENVLSLLQILGLKFKLKVKKTCSIFFFPSYVLVLYTMSFRGRKIKFLEIELKVDDYNLFQKLEECLSKIKGFDRSKIINKSKFEILSALE